MATYAIGDIHGSLIALRTLFEYHTFSPDDTIVFLGDYVDKGTHTCSVINWLLNKQEEYNFVFIQGNHEIMMLSALNNKDKFFDWTWFGGKQTLQSYRIKEYDNWEHKIPSTHWDFIRNGLPYHQIEDTIFVHAGLTPNVPLLEQNRHELFWKKYEFPEAYSDTNLVICGHTARKNGEVADFGHTICIDTYAHGGQWLTCLNVDDRTYIQTNEKGRLRELALI